MSCHEVEEIWLVILPVYPCVAWLTLSRFAWLRLLLLCGRPMNWNCQVCGTHKILLSTVDCWQRHSLCVPWLHEKYACIDDFLLASNFILLLQLSQDLGKSYSFMQRPCVEASLCQSHYPAPKPFMSDKYASRGLQRTGVSQGCWHVKRRQNQNKTGVAGRKKDMWRKRLKSDCGWNVESCRVCMRVRGKKVA